MINSLHQRAAHIAISKAKAGPDGWETALSNAIKAKARSASPWGRELPVQWLAGEVSDRQEIHRLKAGEEQEKERHQLSGPNKLAWPSGKGSREMAGQTRASS